MFNVDISPSIDSVGVGSGDDKFIRFSESGWEGGSNVEVEGSGQPYIGEVDDWRDEPRLPSVGDWEDAPVCFLFLFPLCFQPLFGVWSAVMIVWVYQSFYSLCAIYPHEVAVLLPSTSSLAPSMFSLFQPVATEGDTAQ